MTIEIDQLNMWHRIRERLRDKKLQVAGSGCISTKVPGTTTFWFSRCTDESPALMDMQQCDKSNFIQMYHAQIYAARADICAIASGSGKYGNHLLELTGELPVVFDEQARHLGGLAQTPRDMPELSQRHLASGTNVVSAKGELFLLGMTGARLMLNAELFEKCANAYVLAAATGKPTQELPWLIRYIARSRLKKDEKKARKRTREGLLPEETKGY